MSGVITEIGTVYVNEQVGPNLYRMEIGSPEISKIVKPGQFVHIKLYGMADHILRRPFSIYSSTSELGIIEVLYQVVGYGSNHMTKLELMDKLDIIGPIGSTWTAPAQTKKALLVGGGVGAAPLFMLAEQLIEQGVEVDVVLGAQTHETLVCQERYETLIQGSTSTESALRCATDDGSFGHAGFCTELVKEALKTHSYDYAAVCGPEPMMKIAVSLIADAQVPCEVSLERRMACGIGACLSCVVETVEGRKRACVDGPIFDAAKVVFA